MFAPGEIPPRGKLYIINRGIAIYAGRLLGSGRVWGEDLILAESLQSRGIARAINFLEVFAIDRENLEAIAAAFPEFSRTIRKHAIRLAVRRAFVMAAKERTRREHGGEDRERSLSKAFMSMSSEDEMTKAMDEVSNHQKRRSTEFFGEAPTDDVVTDGGALAEAVQQIRQGQAQQAMKVGELRGELARQAAKQDELVASIHTLMDTVNGLRRDLTEGGLPRSRPGVSFSEKI